MASPPFSNAVEYPRENFLNESDRHSADTVDRLLVMDMAVRRSGQAVRRRDHELKGAMQPLEFSPVIRKRTVGGPRRMVPSPGLTWRSIVCCLTGFLLTEESVFYFFGKTNSMPYFGLTSI